jgi:hypothetical protein
MKRCTRYHQSQLLKDYLHGNVASRKKEIELHMKTCDACTEKLERLKRGDHFAQMISQPTDAPDGWKRLEQTLDFSPRFRWKEQKRIASIAAVLLLGASGIYALFAPSDSNGSFSPNDRTYKEVRLSKIAENTEAHIVTEGVVIAIAIDNQDGDYRIRLQENLRQSGPFVICEILRPSKIPLPEVGKRVRVYGVSRFDNKPEHRWHEVHPVFGIETVQ